MKLSKKTKKYLNHIRQAWGRKLISYQAKQTASGRWAVHYKLDGLTTDFQYVTAIEKREDLRPYLEDLMFIKNLQDEETQNQK